MEWVFDFIFFCSERHANGKVDIRAYEVMLRNAL